MILYTVLMELKGNREKTFQREVCWAVCTDGIFTADDTGCQLLLLHLLQLSSLLLAKNLLPYLKSQEDFASLYLTGCLVKITPLVVLGC